MAAKIPELVRAQVKDAVYRLADEFCYMNKGRIESGIFMENLTAHREVGVVLSQYMSKGVIKTYIKDAVLNRYMKDKKRGVLSHRESDMIPIIKDIYNQDCSLIEKRDFSFIFRLVNGDVLVVCQGTWLKWETALRKALEIIAGAPGLNSSSQKVSILLNIALLGSPSTTADRDQLRNVLRTFGVELNFADYTE
jgi:hypothetical protein